MLVSTSTLMVWAGCVITATADRGRAALHCTPLPPFHPTILHSPHRVAWKSHPPTLRMAAARRGHRPIRGGTLRWPIAALLIPLRFAVTLTLPLHLPLPVLPLFDLVAARQPTFAFILDLTSMVQAIAQYWSPYISLSYTVHCKKRLATFPSPGVCHLPNSL
jgi:hypothetical protein